MTAPDIIERLREELSNARAFIQDSIENGHLSHGDLGNAYGARDELDKAVGDLRTLLAELSRLRAENERLAEAAHAVCSEFAQGHPLIIALRTALEARHDR